jgi:hypothetical protein
VALSTMLKIIRKEILMSMPTLPQSQRERLLSSISLNKKVCGKQRPMSPLQEDRTLQERLS